MDQIEITEILASEKIKKEFIEELDHISKTCINKVTIEDYLHFKKMESWGLVCSILGYLTAWITPNPLSAYLISQGNFARWSLVLHPISHGCFDRSNFIPEYYKSHKFAKGYRRFIDWFDWILADNWDIEHNQLHHYHLGTSKDPDLVGRNSEFLRLEKCPIFLRYILAIILASIWKPFYYATNTIAESKFKKGQLKTNQISLKNWSVFTSEGRQLWFYCLIPYTLYRFVFLPILFFPLGKTAVASVFFNSLIAEVFTNWHSFIMIAPNHTGDDIPTFTTPSSSRSEFFLRQILGSVNFTTGHDLIDFLCGGLNHQIEHHIWPDATLSQLQKARPKLKNLCLKFGVPYIEGSVASRVLITLKTMVGKLPIIQIETNRRNALS